MVSRSRPVRRDPDTPPIRWPGAVNAHTDDNPKVRQSRRWRKRGTAGRLRPPEEATGGSRLFFARAPLLALAP